MNSLLFSLILNMEIAVACLLSGKLLIHYFQLESYQFPGYFRTVRRNLLKSLLPGLCMMILLIVTIKVSGILLPEKESNFFRALIVMLIMICGGMIFGKVFSEKKAKKKFVFTARVKRLYTVSAVVMMILLMIAAGNASSESHGGRFFTAFILVFPILLPIWVALCGLIAWPVEKAISEMYFRDAQSILQKRRDLIRIGITGSWGKTSVKFILGTILGEKFNTYITPASYNTPMGVTKAIRSGLEPGHRVFIAEMGARHVGDIKEMCRLVHPQMGIITSVGPQHLDTFHTIERIIKTKYELIEALPADGEAFFADDNGICRKLYEQTKIKKHLSGMDPRVNEVWAEDIQYNPEGSSFMLCKGSDKITCRTQLLGELNIQNILLCASVAFSLGLNLSQIARGISRIKPVDHRLQLIRHPGGLNVIDDSFNSNIQGARQAFQVLKQFPGKRIVITPGMVELGEQEYEMNRQFGTFMADCCDLAILVGKKRSEAIAGGLREKGYPDSAVLTVASLEDATDLLKKSAGAGDTVLFENDLPDNYTE